MSGAETTQHRLVLYVAGDTAAARAARDTLARLGRCPALVDRLEVEVVDIIRAPERAEQARVIAIPLLVRETPRPERRLVGDMTDAGRVAEALDLPCTEREAG